MKLVDTSLWVEFLRRKGDAQIKNLMGQWLQDDLIAYTCPIQFELLCGVRSNERSDLDAALKFSHHLPFRTADWVAAAELEARFKSKGLNIPRNDLFVAVVAIRESLPLCCRDQHFSAMSKICGEQLKVEQY
ncbi:MAG TPA: PIN domain-containing protein [Verrucomicrobiae bacterium]